MTSANSTTDTEVERRPLKARSLPWFKHAALHLDARVTPNMVSVVGLAAGVASGVALSITALIEVEPAQRLVRLAAIVMILFRGACNILDGVLAVETNRMSPLGQLYNEVPDRVSDAAALIGAGYAVGGNPTLGWAAALLAVFVAYVRTQTRLAGAPPDYRGPMAKPMRMVIVALASGYMLLTPAHWHLGFGPDESMGVMTVALAVVVAGCVATAVRRSLRAARALSED